MFRSIPRHVVIAHVVIFAVLAVALWRACDSASAQARAVGLGDAITPPTYLVYLYPHGSVTYARSDRHHVGENCPHGGFFTDVSAYHWNGTALAPQRWTSDHTLTYWRNRNGRSVSFDGITFHNGTYSPVLVAGWCDQ